MGVLDLKTHLLKYCNAGHECPILITSEINLIPVECNLALGLFEGFTYKSEEMQLSPGDVLLLSTDGLKEATNEDLERFEKIRKLTRDGSRESLIHRVSVGMPLL